MLDVLLLTTLPITYLLRDQPQAARPVFRITKWAASRDRGCVDFGHHQAGRRGGEKQDGIGTGCGQGQREPLAELHSSCRFSLMPLPRC